MRTVTFKTVMDRVFRRRGLDPSAVSATQMGLVADFVTERIKVGWEYTFWKEWTYLEERAYRPLYNSQATYAAADEVWDGSTKYYQSIAGSNQGNALTDATKWTEITSTMERYILLDQQGFTRIGAVKEVYPSELAAQKDIQALAYYIADNRIVMLDSRAGATVWVILRKAVPHFVYEIWTATPTVPYDVGQVVYFPAANATQLQGQCYMALLDTNNVGIWALMENP